MRLKLSYFFIFLICLVGLTSAVDSFSHPKIKAVVFDFGGVVAKTDNNQVADFLAKKLNISHCRT